ncbi:MAG: tetratricopeptide repeat protein [bacterium]
MWIIFLIILIIVGAGALIWLFVKKLPQLRIIDPSSLPESQAKRLKYDLMRQRIERAGARQAKRAQGLVIGPVGKGMQNITRRLIGKLTAVERKYQEKNKLTNGEKIDKNTLAQMIEDARALAGKEEWARAEKALIEVISSDPKNTEAYEELGRLYLIRKNLELAQETFEFLRKLAPDDASVITSLGEVAVRQGKYEEAFGYFAEAIELSPKNPKYLDFYIDSAIEVGKTHEAQAALDQLAGVNPENKKIPIFEERIKEALAAKKLK